MIKGPSLIIIILLAVASDKSKCEAFQELGALISNSPSEGILVQLAGDNVTYYAKANEENGTMIDKMVVIDGINPTRYRVTTITIPVPADWQSDSGQLVTGHGCIETKFLSFDDIKTESKISNESLVVFADDRQDALSQLGGHVRSLLRDQRVTLGFLKRFKPLDDDIRKMLIDERIAFLENLQLPDSLDLITAVRDSKKFYAFLSFFVPFKNATTIYREDGMEAPKFLLNLADLVLVEGDAKWDKFCEESRHKLALFSHALVSDTFPHLTGVELPHFDAEKRFHFSGQTGSNLVAPYRFEKSKLSVSDLAGKSFVFSPCTLINLPFGDEPNFKITKGHLEQWEKDRKMRVPDHSVVLLNTGFWAKWSSPEVYGDLFPSLDVEAAKWLVEERHVSAIGLDSLSFDNKVSIDENKWPTHGYLAEKNIPVMLNLRFEPGAIDNFSEKDSRCLALFFKIKSGTASPLMLFGLPGYDSTVAGVLVTPAMKVGEEAVTEITPSKAPVSTDRWQLGAVIRNQAPDCECDVRRVSLEVYKKLDATSKEPIIGNEVTLAVDPTKNRVTTLTQPGATSVNTTEGCIEVLFIKETDIKVIKKKLEDVRDNMLLIFLAPDLMTLNDDDMIRTISRKNVSLGFFYDTVLSSEIRNKLLTNGISFFENLQRPQDEKFATVDENRVYYGFKFVFSPFSIETSLKASLSEIKPTRKINLADLVVFDSSNLTAMTTRCAKKAYAIMSQKWGPAQQLPAFGGVLRPEFRDNEAKVIFSDHFGTHLDFPYHFYQEKFDATNLPVDLDHPLCFRVSIPFNENPNFSVGKSDLLNWEKNNSKIAENSLVLLDTGYALKKWAVPDKYVLNYPGLSLEAARFLVEERKIAGVAIDSLLLDDYSLTSQMKFPTHSYLAEKGVLALVNAGGQLDNFPPNDGICVMSYLRIENGTGAPVALFGLLPEMPQSVQTTPKPSQASTITSKIELFTVLSAVILGNYF